MRRTVILAVGAAVTLLIVATTAGATEIAWAKIIGADPGKLNADQKTRAAGVMNQLQNTWGCKGTIAKCLAEGDQTARRHAGYVLRMVRKGKSDDHISKGIAKRKESAHPDETFNINLAGHPVKGDPGAKVVLAEFACFQCPFCAHLAPKLSKLKKKFGGKVAHYFKFFPVRSHVHGVSTAMAALAAHKQGKFWQLHDLMFANRSSLDDDDVAGYAQQAGLDMAKFQADKNDQASMKIIEKDKLEGMRFGVEGTPAFFINGKLYQGENDVVEILDRIGEELDIVEGRIK
jgi:protein-disulfide isomerase